MIENIIYDIYVRLLENPVTASGADIDLVLLDRNQFSLGKQDSPGNQTHYKLTIENPESLGLSSTNDSDVNAFLTKIILAMNLTLKRASIDKKQIQMEKKRSQIQESKY